VPDSIKDSEGPALRFREAFQRVLPELRALPETEYVQIHLDIPAAVAQALGVIPEIRAIRPLVERLPDYNLERFDRLEDYTLALGHAHAIYMAAKAPPRSLEQLGEEAIETRDLLLSAIKTLIKYKLIQHTPVEEIGTQTGYRSSAFDLLALVHILREHWVTVANKTPVTTAELEKAEVLADRLLTAVGAREQAPVNVSIAAQDRSAAFTLFISTYDDARRAATFFRWKKNDAERLVPSLYPGRPRRRRGDPKENESTAAAQDPELEAESRPGTDIPVGMPGSNPLEE
jgi:hypothetical protein